MSDQTSIGSIVPIFGACPGQGGGPPPVLTDRFAPRVIVGNVPAGDPAAGQAAPFEYIGDPGDGSGIAAAIAAVVAAGGGDVWIRPGTYDLSAGAVTGFAITSDDVSVRGSGFGTIIRGRADQRSVFDASGQSRITIERLQITMPQAAVGAAGLDVVNCGFQGVMRDIYTIFDGPAAPNPDESITAVYRDPGTGRHRNLYSLVTPFTGADQVAAFAFDGSFAQLDEAWATLGDRIMRVSNQGHRVTNFYGLLLEGGALVTGVNHVLDVSLQSFISSGVPAAIEVSGSQNVQLRGMLQDASGAGTGVEVGAGAVGTNIAMMTFDGFLIAVSTLAGADRTTILGCQFDGGIVNDAGTNTEQAHNQP